jgi:uncharacterized protein YjbI with pentapeptide repeats
MDIEFKYDLNNPDLLGKYLENINQIKKTQKRIWAPDIPRIIKGYTDHGPKHSEKLIYYANCILNSNSTKNISNIERYLLIAGIYLHDIGMQCDVIAYPKILEISKKELGAKYDVEFTSESSDTFTIEEQKEIRKNHHLLSAAWISYAHRTGNTIFGDALQNFPNNLVTDLMDICKYHSTLPITDCSNTFRYLKSERKQVLAAILRLADELDIDSNKVDLKTIQDYRLLPENCFFWWFHNCCTVDYDSPYIFYISIALHPNDAKRYRDVIQEKYVEKFRKKNDILITILTGELYPVKIITEPDIQPDFNFPPFPEFIIQTITALNTHKSPLQELSEEMILWLQVMSYEVEEIKQIDEKTDEIRVLRKSGLSVERRCIRCVCGEINTSDIESINKILNRSLPYGWIICDTRVAKSAYSCVDSFEGINIFTLKDFLLNEIWRPYVDSINKMVENDKIPEYYVDLSCYKEIIDDEGNVCSIDRYENIDEYIDKWLKERGKNHISLLGEFGTGKTWFCRHYTYRQMDRFFKDPIKERFPILITLRDFIKTMDVESLINNLLIDQYKLSYLGNAFDVFNKLNHEGKLLLILDGFDEMARKADYQTVVDNFWNLVKLVDDKSKVILSGRTEYFRGAKESEKILSGREYGTDTLSLNPPQFEVIHLQELNDTQLQKIFEKRLGNIAGLNFYNRIFNIKTLSEIARKPVLIELLINTVDDKNEGKLTNITHVYLFATSKLLLRNIRNSRTFTSTSDKLFFLCELAWEMLSKRELKIHYKKIPEIILHYFKDKIKEPYELDNWDFDLRNQSLLHRNAAGYYEFAHKSMAEFFVALKFAAELNLLSPNVAKIYSDNENIDCVIPYNEKEINLLVASFGHISLNEPEMFSVREFINDLLNENIDDKLWRVIEKTKFLSNEEVKYIGGNAFTILIDANKSLSKGDLKGVNLTGADLTYTSFVDFDFEGTNFTETSCKHSKFENCNLRNAIFYEALLDNSDFVDTNLFNCSFIRARLFGVDFSLSSFEDSVLKNSFILVNGFKNLHYLSLIKNINSAKIYLEMKISFEDYSCWESLKSLGKNDAFLIISDQLYQGIEVVKFTNLKRSKDCINVNLINNNVSNSNVACLKELSIAKICSELLSRDNMYEGHKINNILVHQIVSQWNPFKFTISSYRDHKKSADYFNISANLKK